MPRACLRPLRRLGPDGEIQRRPRGLGFKTRKLAGAGESTVAGQGDLLLGQGEVPRTPRKFARSGRTATDRAGVLGAEHKVPRVRPEPASPTRWPIGLGAERADLLDVRLVQLKGGRAGFSGSEDCTAQEGKRRSQG